MKYAYFNFRKWNNEQVLLTNDLGRWVFVSLSTLQAILLKTLDESDSSYNELLEKGFIYEGDADIYIEKHKDSLRDIKSYLLDATSLHIFVLTNECNARCVYCQAQSEASHRKGLMDADTAQKAVALAFQSPEPFLSIEFQGGEPLLNFSTIQVIVAEAEKKALETHKKVEFSLVSNLTLLNDEMITFLQEHKVNVSTSIDGPIALHNTNRPLCQGGGTYEGTIRGLKRLQEANVCIGAIETTTRYSFKYWKELIDEYRNLGLHNIFLRPLTPLGFANADWEKIGYTADEFVQFYKKALNYIIDVNRSGYYLSEGHAATFLQKILNGQGQNYMELRSPCGAAVGQMAYYYDGNVYTCDEGRMLAEMGDCAFQIGTVDDTYDSLMNGNVCKACCVASTLESTPTCSDCVYQPYCGTCPVLNYALDGDVFSKIPNNYKCQTYRGMLDCIFELLEENNLAVLDILYSWIDKT